MIRPLKNMPYANARVNIHEDGSMILVSYTTPVIYVNANGWITEVTGLYSMTTQKHIGAFMKEFGATYQDAKAVFEKKSRIKLW